MISMNPYIALGVDLNTNSREIDERYNQIFSEINSGAYGGIYVLRETYKILAARSSLSKPHEKAIIDSILTEEDRNEIYKNANLFREAFRMKQMLKDNIGREVIVGYSCYDVVDSVKGEQKSVKPFDEVEVGRLHIPFISSEIVIMRIMDAETNEILYSNPNRIYKTKKMNKTEVLNLISASWGKGTAERQENSKKIINMSDEKSQPEFFDLFLKIKKIIQNQSPEGYRNFIKENELTAVELTLLTAYCEFGLDFREVWNNFSDEGVSLTMKPIENNNIR